MARSLPRWLRVAGALAFALGWTDGLDRRSVASDVTAVEWRNDLVRARAEAASADKLVWVQFTGPWCHNCRRMDAEVFARQRVIDLSSSDFVPVKLRSDEHEELALGFELTGLPATVILRPTGEVVARAQGYLDVESYANFLQSALGRAGRRSSAPAPAVTRDRRPALNGYCPVGLVDGHRLVEGRSSLAAEHDGRSYRFATEAARSAFLKNPQRYVPVNAGRCPVAQVERGELRAGSPDWGVLYEGHLYLCGDASDRARFLKHPDRYARVDVADRGFCPHCWAVDGLVVRGLSVHSATRGGRRYLFPDPSHREAFLASDRTARR